MVDWMFPLTVPFALFAVFVSLTWTTFAVNAAPREAGAGLERTGFMLLRARSARTSTCFQVALRSGAMVLRRCGGNPRAHTHHTRDWADAPAVRTRASRKGAARVAIPPESAVD